MDLLDNSVTESEHSDIPHPDIPLPDIPLPDQPHPDENMEPTYKDTPLVCNLTTDTTSKQNVLLIDSNVLESQLFYESANENTYPIMYSESSTKEELLQVLNDKFPNGLNRLSIVFHDPGYNLYKAFLNNKGLFEESDLLENATTFSENAAFLIDLLKNKNVLKIDFLACNTLNYPIWKQFYEMLHIETNVIVGASDDNTGNVKYGADWLMESTNEDIKNVYFNENVENYASTLAETVIINSIIQNGNFNMPAISSNSYRYITSTTTVPGWTFNNGVIVNNSTAWGFPTPYPNGNQCAVIQFSNSISQNVYLSAGNIIIKFNSCGRPGGSNPVQICLNNDIITTFTPSSTTQWNSTTINHTVSVSGTYTLTFAGTSYSIDRSTAFQNIQILNNNSNFLPNDIYIRQQTTASNLEYSTDNQSTWTSVGSNYPIAITNLNTATNLNVKFVSDITISQTIGSTNGYFYPTTSHITFDGLKSDNSTRCQITIDGVTGYPGFFKNGGWLWMNENDGKSNITVQNFNIISSNNSTLGNYTGWLCMGTYGINSYNNVVKNCSNFGAVTGIQSGGVIGPHLSKAGTSTIINCANYGNIYDNYQQGGVIGPSCGKNNSSVDITNCLNYGYVGAYASGGVIGPFSGDDSSILNITNSNNYGAISGNFSSGVVGVNCVATITKCTNSGDISSYKGGGIIGKWFGVNTNKTCVITNSYNIGNISGTNAGGICGAEVGYSNSSSYRATINITNCYSTGTIASSCGGLLGGNDSGSYSTTPIVTITNCYSSGVIAAGGDGLIAPSLQIKDNITKTNNYIGNGAWSDSEANATLLNYPTDIYTQGTIWTKLAGTNVPYVLSDFNSNIYANPSASSVAKPYSSSAGLFDASYNINSITFNNTPYDNATNYITINSETGELTFQSGLSNGKYLVNVFAAKYANGNPYDYNYSTFTITDLSCFNHDTKILCLNDQSIEESVPIQDLRKGHLVKTYLHGYKKIQCIGKGDMINDPTDWKKCMFKMEKKEENALIEDLIITGWHGLLVDNLEPKEEEFQEKIYFSQRIDDKDILLASASSNFKALDNEKQYTFYNFALEDDGDENKRFGVYANGLLVEIPSKNMFLSKHYDEM
jgi:hypothetical protein